MKHVLIQLKDIYSKNQKIKCVAFVIRMGRKFELFDNLNYQFFNNIFDCIPTSNKILIITCSEDIYVYNEEKKNEYINLLKKDDLIKYISINCTKTIFVNIPNPQTEFPSGRNNDVRVKSRENIMNVLNNIIPYDLSKINKESNLYKLLFDIGAISVVCISLFTAIKLLKH